MSQLVRRSSRVGQVHFNPPSRRSGSTTEDFGEDYCVTVETEWRITPSAQSALRAEQDRLSAVWQERQRGAQAEVLLAFGPVRRRRAVFLR